MSRASMVLPAALASVALAAAIQAAATSSATTRAAPATAPATEPASRPIVPKDKTLLWNGKDFTGWKLFIPDPNVDPNTVWSVRDGVIRCRGKPTGYMRTEADYADYKLHVEWRWAWFGGNSGVLVHMSGPDKVWPKSIECQLLTNNAGDFYVIEGTNFKEHGDKEDRRVPKKGAGSENALGEWNTCEVICRGSTIRVFVNGELKNEATEANVSSGKVLLQSEGGVIEFRNVYVEPADSKPATTTAPK